MFTCVYGVPIDSEEFIGSPGAGVTVGSKPSNVLELKSDCLENQQASSITELFPNAPKYI